MELEAAKVAARKAIYADGRGMIGAERNYLEYRVARAILSESARANAAEAELATLRADNERLGRERDEARAEIERMTPQFVAYEYLESPAGREIAEAERDTLLAQVARVERVLCDLDPENAIDDSLLRDVHARLQVHGEKYPDRAVSVLHRNVVFYTIQAAVRAALTKEPS